MAERRLPFFFLLVVALAVSSTLLGGAPVRAQQMCGADLGQLLAQCREYVAPGPQKDPSKECCAEVQKADVVCLCKNIPSEVEKKISMENAVYVAKFCGKSVPSGTKCGSKLSPNPIVYACLPFWVLPLTADWLQVTLFQWHDIGEAKEGERPKPSLSCCFDVASPVKA
ncbi:hypothetical protein GW17_00018020 [Ensete ventricosum]|nr:hypothetical protein GW17_00018020 [Ensete ventricosum]